MRLSKTDCEEAKKSIKSFCFIQLLVFQLGSNGALMRFEPEAHWGGNKGLAYARDRLEKVKAQHPNITYAVSHSEQTPGGVFIFEKAFIAFTCIL